MVNDEDQDGLHDSWEIVYIEFNIELSDVGDFDSDNLNDLEEFKFGTNPTKADSDEDGLKDGDKIESSTNPLKSDTDDDGFSDLEELTNVIQAI